MTVEQALKNFGKAVDKGLLKIMSKMGIATLDAYCGAQIFEALGIGQELIDVAFVDTPSVLGGVDFATVAEDVLAWHQYGYPDSDTSQAVKLVTWGIYKSRRGGEVHEWSPQVVHALTAVARPKHDGRRGCQLPQVRGHGQRSAAGPAPSARTSAARALPSRWAR